MTWLKDVIIDIAVVICVVLATLVEQTWAAWIVWVYTPLMLLIKAAAIMAGRLTTQLSGDEGQAVPHWFYHVTYAANTVLLGWYAWTVGTLGWSLIAVAWVLIWALSVYYQTQIAPSTE